MKDKASELLNSLKKTLKEELEAVAKKVELKHVSGQIEEFIRKAEKEMRSRLDQEVPDLIRRLKRERKKLEKKLDRALKDEKRKARKFIDKHKSELAKIQDLLEGRMKKLTKPSKKKKVGKKRPAPKSTQRTARKTTRKTTQRTTQRTTKKKVARKKTVRKKTPTGRK